MDNDITTCINSYIIGNNIVNTEDNNVIMNAGI